jgi:hypothetical protein
MPSSSGALLEMDIDIGMPDFMSQSQDNPALEQESEDTSFVPLLRDQNHEWVSKIYTLISSISRPYFSLTLPARPHMVQGKSKSA